MSAKRKAKAPGNPPTQMHFENGSQVSVVSDWSKFRGNAGRIIECDPKKGFFLLEFDEPMLGKAWFGQEELKGVS